MGNAQQKHHSKGKQKGAKAGPKTLQETFQTGDDSFERIEKEEVNGVDPLGNEAAALDDLVERLDTFSVPRKPAPPPVLNKNLVEEESSLPLSFSSGFQPGECSKNVKGAPGEGSNDAPSIQERVMEIREATGDKDDEEARKDMDKAEISGAAESKVVEDAADIEAEVDLPVTGVKLVDGTVELEVELPETAAPSDEPVNDSVTDKGVESLPVKGTESQHWSGMDTSEDRDDVVGDAAESEFEVELPVTGVKPVGDKIEVQVGFPETTVPPDEAPLQPLADCVPSVADNKGAESLPVKATESQDWSERPLKDQETESGREAASSSEEISVAKSSDEKNDGTCLEQPAVPERSPEAGEEVEMMVQQADKKDTEKFKEPVAERVRTEAIGTGKDIHEEVAMASPNDAAEEPTETKESTSVQHATSEAAVQAGEHVEKQPHEGAWQEDSRDAHEEEDGGAFAESQDELRSHFAAVGDDKAIQAEDVSTEKTEDGDNDGLDTSSPVEVSDLLKQAGIPVDESPSGAVEPEEAEEADGGHGQAGLVLEPEQIRDFIPEADDGSFPANQDQVGDTAAVEDFKAEEVMKAAEHTDDAKEPEPESFKCRQLGVVPIDVVVRKAQGPFSPGCWLPSGSSHQTDPEESFSNEENQEKTTQTDGLDVEEIENQALKDGEEAAAPPSQGSEEFKMPKPELELAPEGQRSAEFKDAFELVPEGSEDFKDAVSELDLAQGQKNAEPEMEAVQGSGVEPELEQTPEVQSLKHAEPESQSSEDLQDAEPVFETPRAVEDSKIEPETALEVQGFEEVESAEQESEDLEDSEPNFEVAPEVSEPAGEVESSEEVEHVEPELEQSAAPQSYFSALGSLVRKLVPLGTDEKPELEASDAKAEETSPVVEGTEPREEPVGEREVDDVNEDLTPGDQEPNEQADQGRRLDVQGSETVRVEPTEQFDVIKPGTGNSVTERAEESWVDFDERKEEFNPGTSQVELETEERLAYPGTEATEDAKPEVNLEEEDKPVSESTDGKAGSGSQPEAAVREVDLGEEQPGAFEVQTFQAPQVGQEMMPTKQADEGSVRGGSEAKASRAVVAEEPPSRGETAKEPNDEAEAAESGALVLEPGIAGDVGPVVSELKSEPKLTGETAMTTEEPSLDEHGHSREQNAEPVSVSGYQEPESSKINKEESESIGATVKVAAEGDSSEAAWFEEPSSEPKVDRDQEPVSTAAADHAALPDSHKEPDPDDAEAKPGEPVSAEDEPGMQVGEEQSSSPRVKVVPGHDIAEDLYSNSKVPLASDVITEQKEAPSSSSIEAIANEEVISKMDNEPVKAGKAWTSQDERVEVPGNVAKVEVL